MTEEFKAIVDQLGIDFPGSKACKKISASLNQNHVDKGTRANGSCRQPYDHSTAFLVLSCYLRLKDTQNRALSILHQLMDRNSSCEGGLPYILPTLAIGEFSLAGRPGLQFTVMITLCEEVFGSIGHPGIDGKKSQQMD